MLVSRREGIRKIATSIGAAAIAATRDPLREAIARGETRFNDQKFVLDGIYKTVRGTHFDGCEFRGDGVIVAMNGRWRGETTLTVTRCHIHGWGIMFWGRLFGDDGWEFDYKQLLADRAERLRYGGENMFSLAREDGSL